MTAHHSRFEVVHSGPRRFPVGEQYGIQGTWGGVLYGATKKVGRPRKVKVQ